MPGQALTSEKKAAEQGCKEAKAQLSAANRQASVPTARPVCQPPAHKHTVVQHPAGLGVQALTVSQSPPRAAAQGGSNGRHVVWLAPWVQARALQTAAEGLQVQLREAQEGRAATEAQLRSLLAQQHKQQQVGPRSAAKHRLPGLARLAQPLTTTVLLACRGCMPACLHSPATALLEACLPRRLQEQCWACLAPGCGTSRCRHLLPCLAEPTSAARPLVPCYCLHRAPPRCTRCRRRPS